ncbi:MAG TPA: hypothetical protein VFA46_18125 [Actinomycetes bacterium]|nr:hypothetical protein [Actinomycetes bacterium]
MAAERDRRGGQAAPAHRAPLAVELLAYLGGVLAMIGAMLLAARFWPDLATWTRLLVLTLVALALLATGAVLQERVSPAMRRLRSVLWLLSSAALAFAAGLFAADVLDLEGERVALLVGLTTGAYTAALWRLRPRPLLQLACLAGLATTAGAGVAWIGGDEAAVGLSVWTVGVLWVLAGWRGWLPPVVVALASGAVAMLVGAQLAAVRWEAAGPVFGLASALALLVAGAAGRRRVVAGIGIAGVFVFLPWTVVHFFAGTLGVPVVILLCGVVLLVVAVMLLRAPWRHEGSWRARLIPPRFPSG